MSKTSIEAALDDGLSVIIPNYNHGELIAEAIEAIAKQSRPPEEILVIDDGSTDNSVPVIERLLLRHPTLKLVKLAKNRGAIHAMNRGLAEARGKYVYMAAADDLTLSGLFEFLLAILEKHPTAAFSCCECRVRDMDTGQTSVRPPLRPSHKPAYLKPSEVARIMGWGDNWIISNTIIARRTHVMQADGFDPALASFADGFLFRRLAFQYGCCFVPIVGAEWRVSNQGYSRSQAANVSQSLATMETALNKMRKCQIFPAWYPDVFERRWRFAIGRIAADAKHMSKATLIRLGRGFLGRVILAFSAKIGGRVGEMMAVAYLTLQERPFSVLGLMHTWLSRRFERH